MVNFLKDTAAGAFGGAVVGSEFAPGKGTLIGAGVGAGAGLITGLLTDIGMFSSQRAKDQQILNNMTKAGYNFEGPLPKGLKKPNFLDSTPDPNKPVIKFNGTTPFLAEPSPQWREQQAQAQQLQQQQGLQPAPGQQQMPQAQQQVPQGQVQMTATPGMNAQMTNPSGQPVAPQQGGQGMITGPSAQQQQQQAPMDLTGLNQKFGVNYNPTTGQATASGRPEGSFWRGTPAYNETFDSLNPQQQGYRGQMLNELQNNPVNFNDIARETMRQYEEEVAPRIAERYFGSQNGQFGSSYPTQMYKGSRSLMSTLNAAKSQYAAEREGRMANIAMRPTLTTVSKDATPGFADNMVSAIPKYLAGGGFKGALAGLYPQGQQSSGGQDGKSEPGGQEDLYKNLYPRNAFIPDVYKTGTPEDISSSLSNINQPRSPFEKMMFDKLQSNKKRLGGGFI
jgi:hypothetical protein